MASIMTLEGTRLRSLRGLGIDTPYTGFGPIDALLNHPLMLALGLAAGIYAASPKGQARIAKLRKR